VPEKEGSAGTRGLGGDIQIVQDAHRKALNARSSFDRLRTTGFNPEGKHLFTWKSSVLDGLLKMNVIEHKSAILLFHKPKGLVVTRSDERGRKTVYDRLPSWVLADGWLPVGRLDADSRGLLPFTREGKIVERLTRPGVCLKTYEVWVRGRVTEEHLRRLAEGVESRGEVLRAASVESKGGVGPKSRLVIRLDEGKNRHIRRMLGGLRDPERGTPLKAVGLKRTGFGPLVLDIPSGEWRWIGEEEMRSLEPLFR
jgi:23S rRNA pseudouridine2605 synthase